VKKKLKQELMHEYEVNFNSFYHALFKTPPKYEEMSKKVFPKDDIFSALDVQGINPPDYQRAVQYLEANRIIMPDGNHVGWTINNVMLCARAFAYSISAQ
jgi:hypothetical protein